VSYPAGYGTVVSVAAIDSAKAVASFSQKNTDVELAAPGVGVLSTVSYIESNTVSVGSASYAGNHIENAGRGTAIGAIVYGGIGSATNSAWSGKVVLLDRGTNSFYDKVHNVQLSGGVACVIANNVPGGFLGTLGDGSSSTIPAISVSQEDGAVLKSAAGSSATVASNVQQNVNGYDYFDGTSMATPHVSGVAALIWSKYPGATNAQVRQALTSSAQDLGAAGRDNSYGYGLVQAKAALDALAALNPGSGSGGGGGTGGSTDTTAPLISNVTATATNSHNGSFSVTWTTDEAATSDVTINGALYSDSALTTNHKRNFRGSKGVTYTYSVSSTDAAGNTATAGPFTFTL
jgi:serine protease